MIEVHHYIHRADESDLKADIAFIKETLSTLVAQGALMAGELQRLQSEVQEMAGVVDSAVVLITGLSQQIRDLAQDPAALTALADSLDSKANELAAAVVANTPTP